MRVPGIAWWPGRIRAGSVDRSLACTMDLFTTSLELAGAPVPADRPIDGVSLVSQMTGEASGERPAFFYYRDEELYAARRGSFKAHWITRSAYGREDAEKHDPPLLFHLARDPSESLNVASDYPAELAELSREVERHRTGVMPARTQLESVKREPMPERIQEAPISLQLHSNRVPQEVRFKNLSLEVFPRDRLITVKEAS